MRQAMNGRRLRIGREHPPGLMKTASRLGLRRGKPRFTTICDPGAAAPPDLADRQCAAGASNRLGRDDLCAQPAEVLLHRLCHRRFQDRARRLGVATGLHEDLPLQTVNHALWQPDSVSSKTETDAAAPHTNAEHDDWRPVAIDCSP
jgi:hypothetical protein